MIDGILIIDKEVGITSYDVIRKIKRLYGVKIKIGHAGTLDPFASGVLVIMLGKGTKLMERIHKERKVYEVVGELGIKSDTQDITGEVVDRSEIIPSLDVIESVINGSLIGEIDQVPPHYSAKKINGRKAYELARKGEDFELKPKRVVIHSFDVLDYDYPTLRCRVECSTGTYIRTLINDLGDMLGCFGTARELRRESVGPFDLSMSVNSQDIESLTVANLESKVLDLDKVISLLNNG